MSYIPFPDISPEVFSVTVFGITFALRWYALGYIVGILAGWKLIERMLARPALWKGPAPMTVPDAERLLGWVVFGVILGGRMGYVLFYAPGQFLQKPSADFLYFGMEGNGRFTVVLGVVVAGLLFARQTGYHRCLGRSDGSRGPDRYLSGAHCQFHQRRAMGPRQRSTLGRRLSGGCRADLRAGGGRGLENARHPSQIYEALLEGALMFAALSYLVWRRGWLKRPGAVMGLFLAGYGAARFAVEFVRQPDAQFVSDGNPIGFALHIGGYGLTMGQLLSLPMIAAGAWFLARAFSPARMTR
ncbi:MAG: prolipoprotein diacylglyceryl transferase [Cypionkella sp.]|nr:prolipoprotein diacylglyceryl transferase [Cypionkella sp.]